MNSKRFHGVLALSLVGALAFTGCGDDEPGNGNGNGNGNNTPDATVGDTGGGGDDTGINQPDGGMTSDDTGSGTDTGATDSGTMDGGSVGVPPGEEGRSCAPGDTPCQMGLDCVNLSGMNTPPAEQLLVCLNQCMSDADCAGSSLTPPASTCSPAGLCVQEVEDEGGVADFFRDTPDQTLKGCATGLTRYVGAQFGLEDDQEFACIRTCDSDMDCTTAGIGFCNLNDGLLTNMGQSVDFGMCTRGPGLAGSPCSDRDATQACTLDLNDNGLVFCTDSFRQSFNQGDDAGICTQFCGDTDGNAMTPALVCQAQFAGQAAPRCQTGNFQNPDFGVCSDDCSPFPNDCTTPEPNGCYPFGNLGMPDIARCLQTETSSAGVVQPYDLNGLFANPQVPPTAAENCAGRENECPNGTFCVTFQADAMNRPTVAACLHGCSPTASPAQAGCATVTIGTSTTTSCERLNPMDAFGFCAPPQ